MKSTRQIDIYLTKKSNVRLIDVVQYDTGIHLVFSVKDFDIPSGATAKLYVQKPSGKFVFQEDGISIVDNTILINLENQAITEHGKVPYQVSITNGSDMITTFTGLMMVEKSLKDSNATESKTVIRAFDEVVSDHVAEFQAKAEQIVQACIATIPEDFTVMEAKVNELANAIKGNLSGAVVVADDVSPVEHSPVVKVHGKNLFDISKISTMTPSASAYVSEVGNDYIVVTTPEGYVSNGYCTISRPLKEFCPGLQIGKTYTFNAVTESYSNNVYLPKVGKSWIFGQPMVMTEDILNSSLTFYGLSAQHNQGVGNCLISKIQVEEGTVATAYVPYLDPSTVTVKRCGKNMVTYPYNEMSMTRQGVTFTVANDGKITVNGTSTGAYLALVRTADKTVYLHKDQTYFFLCVPSSGGFASYYAYIAEEEGETFFDLGSGVKVKPTKSGYASITVVVKDGVTVSNVVFNPMLEVGETASVFEPYNGAEYAPTADGTVPGVTSLSPTMTILTDTDGAIVECEYAVDTKTYIDRKISEMMKGSNLT